MADDQTNQPIESQPVTPVVTQPTVSSTQPHGSKKLLIGFVITTIVVLLAAGAVWWYFQPHFTPPQGPNLTVNTISGSGLNTDVVTNGTCFASYYLAAYGDTKKPFYDLTLTFQSETVKEEIDVLAELSKSACADEQKQILAKVLKSTKLTDATDPSLSVMYRNKAGHRFILPGDL